MRTAAITDAVFSTQPINTPIPGQYLPGGIGIQPHTAVPPYSGSNTNKLPALVLASRGTLRLNEPLNPGSGGGPKTPLEGLSNGTINAQAIP